VAILAVKFRLTRYGAKKKPFYRIIVTDSRSPRDGSFIEHVGSYDPMTEPAKVTLDKEKIKVWYQKGARPTKTVENLFKKEGLLKEL
jgi:small subunit ribosomal protein S16